MRGFEATSHGRQHERLRRNASPHGATWKTPVPSLGCKHGYLKGFHLSPGRQGLPVPAQQTAPAGICAAWPGPGQLSQWTTRGRKYSQKQLAKALAQPTPCLYLLRGLDSVQILERKKNRKCFTCYLIWSCCSEQLLVPGEPCGPGQVPLKAQQLLPEGCVGPGRAHLQFPRDFTQHQLSLQQNIPISAVSPVLSHTWGRQIELVSISKSWRNNLHISKLWNLLPEDLLRTLKHLPDI